MASIHPSAIISPQAQLGTNVQIGPFSIVEDDVVIGDGCRLEGRVIVKNGTRMGSRNEVFEGTVLGGKPQHLGAGQELGPLQIGDGNIIRENVTIHRGLNLASATCVGHHNLIMVNVHIAHDCVVGSHVIMANNTLLGGHVQVADRAYLGGAAAVHQFCRIGRLAMVGGYARVVQDIPPFVTVDGASNCIVGLNTVGLRRAGFTSDEIQQLKEAYRVVYRSGMKWNETLAALRDAFPDGPAAEFLPFLSVGKRGFARERRTPKAATVPFPGDRTPQDDESARKVG